MPEKYTIGIDFGTLSGRAVLVRISDGCELCDATLKYKHAVMDDVLDATGERLPADYALQDPSDYLEVLRYVIPKVICDSGVESESIIGVGIDFTCCTVLPVFKNGVPLCFDERFRENKHAYVKLWKHHSAQKYADKLTEAMLKKDCHSLDDYGGKVSSEWIFPKIMEVYFEAPEIYAAADGFIEAGEWIAMYLTGERIKSYVFATAKALYNIETGYPSDELFAEMDEGLGDVVAKKVAARIISSTEAAGSVCKKAADELGLSEKTKVSCPLPDAHDATVALNMKSDGDMCMILGTSSCFMMLGREYRSVDGICGVQKDSMTPGFWGYEAGLCCMGDLFAWAADKLAPASYRADAEKKGIPVLRYMIEKAAKKVPGETGLLALDWWNGNRNILVDSSLSGMIVGLDLQSTAEDILRALIEATAFATRVIFENYKSSGIEIKRVIAAGGIAGKDPFTMQLYSDVLNMDIRISGSSQVPAVSAAIYAAAAAGLDIYSCMESMSRLSDTVYHPNPEASAVYDKLYGEYVTLHDYFGRGGNNVMKRLKEIKRSSNVK